MRSLLTIVMCGLLAGCTQFPELDQTVSADIANQPYPELRPQSTLLAEANAFDADAETAREDLSQRADALGARADAIRTQEEPDP